MDHRCATGISAGAEERSVETTDAAAAGAAELTENGRDLAASLDYLPLPPPLVRQVEGYWNAEFDADAKGPAITGKGSPTPG